jgi:hypothetical protein
MASSGARSFKVINSFNAESVSPSDMRARAFLNLVNADRGANSVA